MKIQRKYMAHYLNAAFGEEPASYVRLGRDLEEYAPELSANVEKKTNILGQTSVVIDSYQKQGEVTPFYAEDGDPLFEKLQAILDGDLVLDDLKNRHRRGQALGRAERRLPRRARGVLYRDRQLRRRYHRLPDPLQCALHRRQDQGYF